MSYKKNDLSKYVKNRNVDEIFTNFMDTYKSNNSSQTNSVLNSTAFSECKRSLLYSSSMDVTRDSSFHIDINKLRGKKDDIKTKANDYKFRLTSSIDDRMERRENRLNKNIDLLNIKFGDIRPTLPVMCLRERFLNVSSYNKKAQGLLKFSDKTVEHPDPINVFLKSASYKKACSGFYNKQ
jgi:hypothetical protein